MEVWGCTLLRKSQDQGVLLKFHQGRQVLPIQKRMTMISDRHIKAWEKFNQDVEAFRIETEDAFAILYEDAYTTREVKDFKMTKTGILTWIEEGKEEKEQMMDEDDAREWLSFWRANLRRAKRYWEMDTEKLDAIQDGLINDEED